MAGGRNFLGPYRLVRLIRVGSTCQVWEAINEHGSSERVALKALVDEHVSNKTEIAGLKHEFEVAKTLSHSNIIKIHEFKHGRDSTYLVLELYSEDNLKQLLRDVGTDFIAPILTKIIDKIAIGLSHLHDKGWIHCDIKPDNFLVSREGDLKIIDFAITQKKKNALVALFGKSKVQGTRSYMSPEQIRGKGIAERSDIYSLGCVIFELLAGKAPYTATSPDELLSKHLSAAIPNVTVNNGNVTPEFSKFLMTMLAKKPDRRPETMTDILRAVREIRIFKNTPKAPPAKTPADDS